jgi:BarA-like signal transduction histidine kinase
MLIEACMLKDFENKRFVQEFLSQQKHLKQKKNKKHLLDLFITVNTTPIYQKFI